MLFDAHWHAFSVFGGVPRRGIYDNIKTAVDRAARRADHISDKMGWPSGILEGGDWGKPKEMHWRIYERFCREQDALSDRSLVGIMDPLNHLSGRF